MNTPTNVVHDHLHVSSTGRRVTFTEPGEWAREWVRGGRNGWLRERVADVILAGAREAWIDACTREIVAGPIDGHVGRYLRVTVGGSGS